MLGRSQMNVAPILGVLMVLFVGFSWMLRMVADGADPARQVSAPHLAAALGDLSEANVVQLQADDGVLWGDFVATVSSVRHITRGEVLVVSVEP